MDFIEGLPNSNGCTVILVVERLSKYGHFFGSQTPLFRQDSGWIICSRNCSSPFLVPLFPIETRCSLVFFWGEYFRLQD